VIEPEGLFTIRGFFIYEETMIKRRLYMEKAILKSIQLVLLIVLVCLPVVSLAQLPVGEPPSAVTPETGTETWSPVAAQFNDSTSSMPTEGDTANVRGIPITNNGPALNLGLLGAYGDYTFTAEFSINGENTDMEFKANTESSAYSNALTFAASQTDPQNIKVWPGNFSQVYSVGEVKETGTVLGFDYKLIYFQDSYQTETQSFKDQDVYVLRYASNPDSGYGNSQNEFTTYDAMKDFVKHNALIAAPVPSP
jgi:hypothetical protein